MDRSVFERAYKSAAKHYKKAALAVSRDIESFRPRVGIDEQHHLGSGAIALHHASLTVGYRIWAGTLSYEKAEEVLSRQFHDFPAEVCREAVRAAYVETR